MLSLKHRDRTYRLGLRLWEHEEALVGADLYATRYVSVRSLLNNAIGVVEDAVSAVRLV